MLGKPGREGFKVEHLAVPVAIAKLLLRKKYQGVKGGGVCFMTVQQGLLGATLRDTVLRPQRG